MIKIIIILILSVSFLLASKKDTKQVTFDVKNFKKVNLKLLHLTDSNDKSMGLKNKTKVEPFDGLILEFNENESARIWMKEMYIPIDIIFLSSKGDILSLIESATPCTKDNPCTIFTVKNAKYVIETKSGFIIQNYINYVNKAIIE